MKKRPFLIFVLSTLAVGGVALTWYNIAKGPDRVLGRAQEAIQSGEPAQAITLLEELLETRPNLYQAHILIGQARISMQDFDGAREAAQRVSDLRPKDATGQIFSASIDRVQVSNTLGKPAVMIEASSIAEALTVLENGLQKLKEAESRENSEPGQLESERGLLWRAKSRAFELRAALKRQTSRQAATAGDTDDANTLRTEARAATEQMNRARTEAISHLMTAHRDGNGQSQPALAMLDVALSMGVFEPVADLVEEVQTSEGVQHPALYFMAAQLIGRQDRYGFLQSRESRTAEALEMVEAGIKNFPDSIDLQVTAGQLELDRGNRQEALRYINDVLTRSPQYPLAMIQRGRAMLLGGQFGEAQALLQQFRGGGKADLQRSLYLAESFISGGEGETAKKMLLDILELVPEDIDARLALAKHLGDAGEFEEADQLLEEGTEAVPTSAELVTARVELALRRGRPADVAAILKQAFSQLPEYDHPVETLIGLTLTVGAQQVVHEELASLGASMGEGPIGDLARAAVHLADGKVVEAKSLVEGFDAAQRSRPGVLFATARIRALQGDREGAADALEQAVDAGPDVDLFRHAAAELYGAMGWHGSALMTYEELLIQEMYQPGAQLLGAKQALFANKPPRFSEHMASLAQSSGEMPTDPLKEALLALHQGAPEKCVTACEGINSLESLWLSGLALEELGRLKEARQKYLAAIEMDPNRPELFQLCAKTFHNADEREAGKTAFGELAAKNPINAKLGETLLLLFVQDWAGAGKGFETILGMTEKGLTRRTEFAMKLGLGTCYGALGQTDQLSTLVKELAEGEKKRFAESIEAADFLTRVNAADRALPVLEKAEQKLPAHHASAWQRKQITDRYARLGQVERAVSVYDRLIEASPLVAAFHTAKINLLRQAGRTEEAWQAVNRALALHPTDLGFHIAQARMLSENHRFREAVQKYRSFRSQSEFARRTADNGLRYFCAQIGLQDEVLRLLEADGESDGEPNAKRLARVQSYVELNRMDEAVAECDRISRTSPAYRNGRLAIAQGYARGDDTDRALTILKALNEEDPPFAGAYPEMLRVLREAERHEEIIATADEQLAKLPAGAADRTSWLSEKGQAALHLNRLDVARACWEELVQLVPTNAVLATQFAAWLVADGSLDEAKKILNTDATKNYVGNLLLATISLASENSTEAQAALQGIQVEQMSPGYRQCAALVCVSADVLGEIPIAHWQAPSSAEKLLAATATWATDPAKRALVGQAATCLLLSELQLPQVGIALGQRVMTEAPEIPLGYWVVTSAYDRSGDAEKGLATVQVLVEKFSDLVSARDSLVQRLIDADRLDEAEKALAAWTESGGQPEVSYAWSQGSYLLARDRSDESVAWFEKCLKADPGFVPAKAKLVETWGNGTLPNEDARKRMVDMARQLIQGDPRDFGYRMMLGWALAQDQSYDEAIVQLNAALTGMPRSAPLHYRLGWTYEKQGQAGMAKLHYGQAISYGLEDQAEAEAAAKALESLANPVPAQPKTAPATTQPVGAGG